MTLAVRSLTSRGQTTTEFIYHDRFKPTGESQIIKCLPQKIMVLKHCAGDFIYFSFSVFCLEYGVEVVTKFPEVLRFLPFQMLLLCYS